MNAVNALRFAAAGLLVFELAGCHSYAAPMSPQAGIARAHSGEVRVTRTDHSALVLTDTRIEQDSVIGVTSDATRTRVAVALSEVTSVEPLKVDAGRTAALGGGIVLAALGILTVVAIIAVSQITY